MDTGMRIRLNQQRQMEWDDHKRKLEQKSRQNRQALNM